MIGGIIMVHGDDRGLVLPPRVAPVQVVILPIAMHKEGVLEKARALAAELEEAGLRVELDERDQTAGWKFNEWEMKGVPVRLELGPRDIEAGQATLVRRDSLEKFTLPLENLAAALITLLDGVHEGMYQKALAFREQKTVTADTFDGLAAGVQSGFALAHWCGERGCEDAIKEKTGATARCMPLGKSEPDEGAVCTHCGKKAVTKMYFAKAY